MHCGPWRNDHRHVEQQCTTGILGLKRSLSQRLARLCPDYEYYPSLIPFK